jgi:hypothetical protein
MGRAGFPFKLFQNSRDSSIRIQQGTTVSKPQIFWAIWQKESHFECRPKDGDAGKAIGPLQIWEKYFGDCKKSGLTFYQQVRR